MVDEIFTKYLPSIPSSTAETFGKGMRAYYDAFKLKQEGDMNYEKATDYHNACHEIMVVRHDDFWIYAPHFQKILGLSISKLFKTKITMLGCSNDANLFYCRVFVDGYGHRFTVSFQMSVDDPGMISIFARFPLSDTKVQMMKIINDKELSTPEFNASSNAILVQDALAWHDGE